MHNLLSVYIYIEAIVLVSFMDRPKLFCSSTIDLLDRLDNPTPFCKLGGKCHPAHTVVNTMLHFSTYSLGILQSYFALQVTMWWILNILALFWKIQFPFHARYYDNTKRTKYIHIASIVISFVFPIIAPMTISARGGFTITRFPPIVCIGRDADASFYTIVFPTTIIYAVGITLMLLILWRIRRVRCFNLVPKHVNQINFSPSSQHMNSNLKLSSGSSRRIVLFSPAERKIFIVLLYYTFSIALQLTTFSLSIRNINSDVAAYTSYISCQRSGEDSACTLNLAQNPFWSLFALIVLLLLPAINLFFAIRLGDVKLLCKPCLLVRERITPQHSTTSAGTSSLPSSTPAEL